MYRRSDNSDSTASSRTQVTGQSGKLPRDGIVSESKNAGTIKEERRFDSIEIPVCVNNKRSRGVNADPRHSHTSAQNRNVRRTEENRYPTGQVRKVTHTAPHSQTSSTPRVSRPQGGNRTGSSPYLYNTSEQMRVNGSRTQTGMTPVRRRKKKTKTQIILELLVKNQKAVLTFAVCLVFACVAIPLAVYGVGAAANHEEAPDFEMIAGFTTDEVLDAGDVKLEGILPTDTSADGDTADTAGEVTDGESTDEETSESEDTSAEDATDDPIEATGFNVTVSFYDREAITCTTEATTLRQIMAAAGYPILDGDRPSVGYDEVIEGEAWISVDKVEYKTVTESEAIPFETETHNVQSVPRGTTKTVTYGKNGAKDTVYTVEYLNGVEVSRTKEYDYIALYPTNQINYYGTGGTYYAPDGTAYSYSHYVTVRATYYNIYGNTASGMPTGHNVVAVDPNVFPLGTQMYVVNDYFDMGVRIAADTGGAVKGNLIDLWMDETNPYYYDFAHGGVWEMTAYILD